MTAEMRELLTKVEKGTEGDRDLNKDLLVHFCNDVVGVRKTFETLNIPDLTGSIDSAVKLLEKTLPGWGWARDPDGTMTIGPDGAGWWTEGKAATPSLSLVACVLRVTIDQKERTETLDVRRAP